MTTATATAGITDVLNGTLEAVQLVIPLEMTRHQPTLVDGPLIQPEMGVLIGITGQIRGRLVVESTASVFSTIAASMYGMRLEGSMLESFVGELGNMIGGNMCTQVSTTGLCLDITPPTVIVGESKLTGFSRALRIPVVFDGAGSASVILILEHL